jgi:hypothetical protein
LAKLRAERSALKRAAAKYLLDHYRQHRSLPGNRLVIGRLLGDRVFVQTLARAEIEHWFGIAKLMLAFEKHRENQA